MSEEKNTIVRVTPNPLGKTSSTQEELEQLLLEGLDSGESQEMTKKDWDDIRYAGLSVSQPSFSLLPSGVIACSLGFPSWRSLERRLLIRALFAGRQHPSAPVRPNVLDLASCGSRPGHKGRGPQPSSHPASGH